MSRKAKMHENRKNELLNKMRFEIARQMHKFWKKEMQSLYNNNRQNKGGSVTILQSNAESWIKQFESSFDDLDGVQQQSLLSEAEAIMEIIRIIVED